MTVCFKIAVVGGFLISAMNIGTDIASFVNFDSTFDDYESHVEKMIEAIEGEASSNFKSDSDWFTAISAEYEVASDFDKEYVYCDVVALQSKPDELYDEGSGIYMSTAIFMFMSGFSFVIGWMYMFWLLKKVCDQHHCDKNCRGPHMGEHQDSKSMIQKPKREFMRWSAIRLFMAAGPLVAMNYLTVLRRGQANGFECHEKFYDCGVAGSCDIGDMMVPVALNSSYLDLITSNTLLMLAIFSGVVDIAFSFVASTSLYLLAADVKYIWLPFLTLIGASITIVWMLFIDEKVDALSSSTYILLIAHLPILVLLAYGIVGFCKENKADREFQERRKARIIAEKMAELGIKQKRSGAQTA